MNTNKVQSTRRDYSHNWCTPLYTKYRWNIQQFSERFDIRFTTRHFAVSFALVGSDLHVQGTCFYLLLLCGAVIHWFYFEWLNSWLLQMFDDRLYLSLYGCQVTMTAMYTKKSVWLHFHTPKKRLEIRGVGQGLLGTYNVKGTHSSSVWWLVKQEIEPCWTSGGMLCLLIWLL